MELRKHGVEIRCEQPPVFAEPGGGTLFTSEIGSF
jgi:hypothetical protein